MDKYNIAHHRKDQQNQRDIEVVEGEETHLQLRHLQTHTDRVPDHILSFLYYNKEAPYLSPYTKHTLPSK
jgi:hypothetical protein